MSLFFFFWRFLVFGIRAVRIMNLLFGLFFFFSNFAGPAYRKPVNKRAAKVFCMICSPYPMLPFCLPYLSRSHLKPGNRSCFHLKQISCLYINRISRAKKVYSNYGFNYLLLRWMAQENLHHVASTSGFHLLLICTAFVSASVKFTK
jgi:hypothetical protein